MVDDAALQHRPRTTRELRHRLIAAAETAGAESPTFHEALEIATAYLEMGVDSVTCPRCGSELERQSNGRYECYGCSISPLWSVVIGIDEPHLNQPSNPERDTSTIYDTSDTGGYQWQP